jgi:hypothetical protein
MARRETDEEEQFVLSPYEAEKLVHEEAAKIEGALTSFLLSSMDDSGHHHSVDVAGCSSGDILLQR